MLIEILNQQLGDEVVLSSSRKERTVPDESTKDSQQPNSKVIIIPDKFKDDVNALLKYLHKESEPSALYGLSITISLKELLEICPRDRRKIDAYNSLKKYLSEELSCKLIIKSQKTK